MNIKMMAGAIVHASSINCPSIRNLFLITTNIVNLAYPFCLLKHFSPPCEHFGRFYTLKS